MTDELHAFFTGRCDLVLMSLAPVQIVSSRASIAKACFSALLIVLVPVLLLVTGHESEPSYWFLIVFGGVMLIASALLLWRPSRFILDQEGFSIIHLGRQNSAKRLWRDVELFKPVVLPLIRDKTQDYVSIKYRPGVHCHDRVSAALNKVYDPGIDALLSMTWPRPVEMIAEELNEYMAKAKAHESTNNMGI